MSRRILTQMQAGEIRRMRAELDDWGAPKWTGTEIAVHVGVSESTVWRVLNKQAAYAKMGKVEPGGLSFEAASAALTLAPVTGMEAEIAASQARLQQLLAQPDAMAAVRTPPPSPLDGGDAPAETDGKATSTLAERARAYDVDIELLRKLP